MPRHEIILDRSRRKAAPTLDDTEVVPPFKLNGTIIGYTLSDSSC